MKNLVLMHVFSGVFSFFLTYYLVLAIIRLALRLHILDVPDGKIKCHKNPVPYLGGLAVYAGLIITLVLVYPFDRTLLWLLAGVTVLMLTGLIDDLKALKPWQKLLGQFVAVFCFLTGGFSLKTTFLSSWSNMTLSGFWMLSVINAFNLVDVMDGLSSLIAIIGTIGFLVIALLSGKYLVSLLLVAFLGAVCAFFLHNKPSAKIYLGDAGSLFIGGFLSIVPFLIPWRDSTSDVHYAPAIILAVPLLEVFFLIIIRTRLGIPFYKGSPHHYSLYLLRKGWSKWQVLAYTAIMSTLFAAVGILHFMKILSFMSTLIIGAVIFYLWCLIIFTRFFDRVSQVQKSF